MENTVGSDDPTPLSGAGSVYPTLPTFSRKLVTATRWSLAYIRGYLFSLELPFEPLNTWGHPSAERRHPNTWDQQIYQEIQFLEECKCARALGPTELWSSESLGLVTLGVWWHLDNLGDRKLLVSSWSLWEPQEEEVVHGLKPAVPEMEKGYS